MKHSTESVGGPFFEDGFILDRDGWYPHFLFRAMITGNADLRLS